jgi:hypothetical protein
MARARFRLALKVTPARSGRNISLQANQSNSLVGEKGDLKGLTFI